MPRGECSGHPQARVQWRDPRVRFCVVFSFPEHGGASHGHASLLMTNSDQQSKSVDYLSFCFLFQLLAVASRAEHAGAHHWRVLDDCQVSDFVNKSWSLLWRARKVYPGHPRQMDLANRQYLAWPVPDARLETYLENNLCWQNPSKLHIPSITKIPLVKDPAFERNHHRALVLVIDQYERSKQFPTLIATRYTYGATYAKGCSSFGEGIARQWVRAPWSHSIYYISAKYQHFNSGAHSYPPKCFGIDVMILLNAQKSTEVFVSADCISRMWNDLRGASYTCRPWQSRVCLF